MRSKIYFNLILIVLMLLQACESDVLDVNIPFRQKLVVSAFLCPSDTITNLYVTSNRRLYGELTESEPAGNLTGFISNGSEEVRMDTSNTGFTLNPNKMKIEYGKTYKIRVSSDLGLIATGECTVPEKNNFSISIDTSRIDPARPYAGLNANVAFNDIPGEKDFYRLKIFRISYYKFYGNQNESNEILIDNPFISDKNIDGSRVVRSFDPEAFNLYSADSMFLVVKLYHTEESYYVYHKSLENYHGGRNPFAEFSPVYSNIEGGLGIFTSYTIDSAVLRLK